jgi:hypothetical protein
MRVENSYFNSFGLIMLLFAISFFKDDITPDYLNTPAAHFLASDSTVRITSFALYPWFWINALIYSAVFAVLPYFILVRATNKTYAKWVLLLLVLIVSIEYVGIFIHHPKLDTAFIPKINRFYHSPLFTLFFLAAFTVNKQFSNG